MNKFRVVLTDRAVNDLKDIPREARTQINENLRGLEAKPFASGIHIKRLRGFRPPVYRLRSGNFRVLYRIQGDTVAILRVIDPKRLERIIKRLKI
ncbi:MAG: type II toxin-antitoxin system RelE/ParE family toxin [Proteobacteria bacterium]|nr:type II toxin-antitoxin system RelE/ParE family toxin [Pseudomonadota bacterium]